jgi:hypothetical protein
MRTTALWAWLVLSNALALVMDPGGLVAAVLVINLVLLIEWAFRNGGSQEGKQS